MKTFLFVIFLLIASSLMAQGNVAFTWDPYTPSSDVSGFKLYQSKISPVCTNGIPTSGTSVNIATFTGGTTVTGSIPLPKPGTYYWILTSVSVDGSLESDCSNEVSQKIKPKPPVLKPVTYVLSRPIVAVEKLAGLFRSNDQDLKVKLVN